MREHTMPYVTIPALVIETPSIIIKNSLWMYHAGRKVIIFLNVAGKNAEGMMHPDNSMSPAANMKNIIRLSSLFLIREIINIT